MSMFAVFLVSLSVALLCRTAQSYKRNIWQAVQAGSPMSDSSSTSSPSRTPVYFSVSADLISWRTRTTLPTLIAAVGREITTKIKPKAVVIFQPPDKMAPIRVRSMSPSRQI
ncbi:hypothetical protein F4818DRAFT_63026 [Hypoxylon cercidicola]|nr:hypothetical protein F4818DRAFT_63026 [Hypoxylon cercidicola]